MEEICYRLPHTLEANEAALGDLRPENCIAIYGAHSFPAPAAATPFNYDKETPIPSTEDISTSDSSLHVNVLHPETTLPFNFNDISSIQEHQSNGLIQPAIYSKVLDASLDTLHEDKMNLETIPPSSISDAVALEHADIGKTVETDLLHKVNAMHIRPALFFSASKLAPLLESDSTMVCPLLAPVAPSFTEAPTSTLPSCMYAIERKGEDLQTKHSAQTVSYPIFDQEDSAKAEEWGLSHEFDLPREIPVLLAPLFSEPNLVIRIPKGPPLLDVNDPASVPHTLDGLVTHSQEPIPSQPRYDEKPAMNAEEFVSPSKLNLPDECAASLAPFSDSYLIMEPAKPLPVLDTGAASASDIDDNYTMLLQETVLETSIPTTLLDLQCLDDEETDIMNGIAISRLEFPITDDVSLDTVELLVADTSEQVFPLDAGTSQTLELQHIPPSSITPELEMEGSPAIVPEEDLANSIELAEQPLVLDAVDVLPPNTLVDLAMPEQDPPKVPSLLSQGSAVQPPDIPPNEAHSVEFVAIPHFEPEHSEEIYEVIEIQAAGAAKHDLALDAAAAQTSKVDLELDPLAVLLHTSSIPTAAPGPKLEGVPNSPGSIEEEYSNAISDDAISEDLYKGVEYDVSTIEISASPFLSAGTLDETQLSTPIHAETPKIQPMHMTTTFDVEIPTSAVLLMLPLKLVPSTMLNDKAMATPSLHVERSRPLRVQAAMHIPSTASIPLRVPVVVTFQNPLAPSALETWIACLLFTPIILVSLISLVKHFDIEGWHDDISASVSSFFQSPMSTTVAPTSSTSLSSLGSTSSSALLTPTSSLTGSDLNVDVHLSENEADLEYCLRMPGGFIVDLESKVDLSSSHSSAPILSSILAEIDAHEAEAPPVSQENDVEQRTSIIYTTLTAASPARAEPQTPNEKSESPSMASEEHVKEFKDTPKKRLRSRGSRKSKNKTMVVVDPLAAFSEGHSSVNDADVPATDPTSPTLSDPPVNDEPTVSIVEDQSTSLVNLGPASTEGPAKDDFTPAPIPDSDVASNLSRTEPLPNALAIQEAVISVEPQVTGGTKECLTPIQNLDIYETLEPEEPFSTVRRSVRRTQSKQHKVPAAAEELQSSSSSVASPQAARRSRSWYPQRRVWFEVYRNWASVPDREKDEILERVQDPEVFWMKTMSNLSEWSPPISQTGDTIQWFY